MDFYGKSEGRGPDVEDFKLVFCWKQAIWGYSFMDDDKFKLSGRYDSKIYSRFIYDLVRDEKKKNSFFQR